MYRHITHPLSIKEANTLFNRVKRTGEEIRCTLNDQRGTMTFVPQKLRLKNPFVKGMQESSAITIGRGVSKER